ncbi:Stage III sporulation protein E [Anaerohalosphaera lusitana]|uniref:Stage III sporulation protein E n=1 Tax=Anaerohalosphaera lusitana TaxID=1936003 RepID=A0A1U9NII1_9BACT|nr:DNA translocase FtsK [Anaerohalosphaera lusitana]AQT67316.1 Stage III sporulation protein E [Anaerohalosphaera lusitana]
MKAASLYKVAIEGILLAVCIFLFFSCLSFNIADPPSTYVWPNNVDVANWCGPIGAFFAYYLIYYIGPGSLLLFAVAGWMLTVNLSGTKISQLFLRAIGLALLIIAASATVHLIDPYSRQGVPALGNGLPIGNGGIIGVSIGHFLQENVAALGTFIIMASAWLVGAILLADSLVLAIVKGIGMFVAKTFGIMVPAVSAAKERSSSFGTSFQHKSLKRKKRFSFGRKHSGPEVNEEDDHEMESTIIAQRNKQRELEFPEDDQQGESEETPQEAGEQTEQSSDEQSKEKPALKIKRRKPKKQQPYVQKSYEDYSFPPLDLLEEPIRGFESVLTKMVEEKAEVLEAILAEFGIDATVVNAEPGPAITMYELQLAPGVKVSQISGLSNDMARALGAGSVRVVAPLPGKHTVGVEAPNSKREIVRLKELMERAGSKPDKMNIPVFLGKTSSGTALISDLSSMPHCLIAGTTGSGKSVCINTIISSILLTRRPDEVKMILVDPKMVEMSQFENIPHLMCPTVTEMKRAEQILEWAVTKMDERYEILREAKVRNVASYNMLDQEELIERFNPQTPEEEAKIPKKLPYIVIVIDELADLMMTSAKEVESYIVRIAQKSRAVGIHLVIATQRPQATVVTGLIKANMPCRISFRVAGRMDSRIILDTNGGETLLGQGDMLFLKPGTSELVRSQGAFMDDAEIRRIVKYLKDVAEPQFHPELMQLGRVDLSEAPQDELFDEGVKVVLETKRGSVSLLQRRLGIGYARASRMIEMMASMGILGEYKGSQAREVTMTVDEYENLKNEYIQDEVKSYDDLTAEMQDEDDSDDDDYEEEYLEATSYDDDE